MIILRFLHYLFGYVVFECYGFFAERFLNLISKRKIALWSIKRCDRGLIRAKISAKDFKLLRAPARKAQVKIKIIHKKGLPFIFHRYRKRKGFLIGFVIFLLLLWVLSSFIWSIEINGNKTLSSERIISVLKEGGIKQGVMSGLCDINSAKLRLMTVYRELCWVDIAIKGSKVIVSVKEGVSPPEIIAKDKPCNIIAKKDGQITFIEAYDGLRLLKKGDTVRKGELIISGVLDSTAKGYRLVHSRGTVKATTLTHIKAEIPLKSTEKTRTNNIYKRYSLQFLNLSVKLYIGEKIKFESFEEEIYKNEVSLGKNIILPLGMTTEAFFEIKDNVLELTEQEGKINAEILLLQKEKTELFGTLLDRKISFKTENNIVFCEGEYICEEEISQEEKIEKN